MAKEKRQPGPIRRSFVVLRNRVLSGLFLALPFLITFFIIKWIYDLLATRTIAPIAKLLLKIPRSQENGQPVELPGWIENFAAPVAAVFVIIAGLFLLGMFFRSRIHRLADWILLQVPGVSTIYSAVQKVIDSIRRSSNDTTRFKRVVLVKFPHPGMRVPAFVTSSCTDVSTGQTILCIYVPTTPIPTSGYMILVPENEVTELSWDLQDTLQAIVSGGITVPPKVEYYPTSNGSEPVGE